MKPRRGYNQIEHELESSINDNVGSVYGYCNARIHIMQFSEKFT